MGRQRQNVGTPTNAVHCPPVPSTKYQWSPFDPQIRYHFIVHLLCVRLCSWHILYIVSHKLRTWVEERYDICTPFAFYFMDFSVKTFVTCCFSLQFGLGLQINGSPDYCFANPMPSQVKTQERVTSALGDAGCEGHRTDCGPQDR